VTNPAKVSERTLAGRCPCGAVPYAVADLFNYAANCHCSNCRGMISGDENGNDTDCKLCGSLLYSLVRAGAFIQVAMGTLVEDPTIRPSRHIFVGSKAPWFTITDELPQYEEHAIAAGALDR